MQYQRHEQPGCGGCLFLIILLVLLTGGAPLLFELLGLLLFGGFFSIIAIMAAFWAFSYYVKRQISNYEQSQSQAHNTFVFLLVNILVKIAQIDGKVTREEINTIHRFFQHNLHYGQSQLYWVKELVKEALTSSATMESLLYEFKKNFAYEPRLILLELIYQVLYTNDHVTEQELQMVGNIAAYLEINDYEQQTIKAKFRHGYGSTGYAAAGRTDESRYYDTLGLEPGADFTAIKSAYRKLSMQYHPDKVRHLGDEFRKVAEEKMKELNVAYDFFKKKYNNQ
jgi:DnaJ like chaperone protein